MSENIKISPTNLALIAAKVFEYMKQNDIAGNVLITIGDLADTQLPSVPRQSSYITEPEKQESIRLCQYTDERGVTVTYPCP